MNIRTHLVRPTDGRCQDCQIEIPLPRDGKPLDPGELIGLLECLVPPNISYRPGEHDSNQRCYAK